MKEHSVVSQAYGIQNVVFGLLEVFKTVVTVLRRKHSKEGTTDTMVIREGISQISWGGVLKISKGRLKGVIVFYVMNHFKDCHCKKESKK